MPIFTSPEEQPTQIQVPTTFTSAERAYATTTGKQAITLTNALRELGELELFQNPHYGNEDWTLKTATQLTIIQTVYNRAIELEPPNSMTHIHYKYVQALKHYNTGAELLAQVVAQGADEMNPDLINEVITELETGAQLFNEVTDLIQEFMETRK